MKKITLLLALLITSIGFSQAPTTAPDAPSARDAANVVSIFTQTTDANTKVYADIAANLNPNWGETSGRVEFPAIAGDLAIKIPSFNYQGIDFDNNRQNLVGFEKAHIDIWTNNATVGFSLIWAGGEQAVSIAAKPGEWQSLEIDLSQWPNADLSTIRQLKFDGGNGTTDEIYIDNLFFSKPPADPLKDATLSDLKVEGVTISGFSAATTSYTYEVQIGTTTAPSITDATTTNSGASAVINQATSVPGDATVVVTASNGTDTKTYTVSIVATLPNASPTPSTYGTHLALQDNITDTGTFTNFWNADDFFGATPTFPDLDATSAVNNVAKINLAIGWGGGITSGGITTTDVSDYDTVHIDYFIPSSEAAGSLGHQFYLDLISRTGGANSEAFYGFGTTVSSAGNASEVVDEVIVFDSWQSIDIPLATFAGKGFDVTTFFQFKIGASSDLRTKLGYFDNIYFYKASTLNTESNELLGFSMFPNPATDRLNISAKETIQNADIFNVLGKKVMSVDVNDTKTSINISNLSSGIYLVKYNVGNTTGTAKFIKQ
ncbi:T9SS type A sorting domain-containing protein [Polaribacter sp. Hel_I_88]|uniref:T9SS type A sorting domain-containing protein n=1 Tax=Polaribacter sp. Hel_I_88 TaxID=1250006 RepID=UPI0006916BC4|nr:T9SS type A sorting domain-containing protein [Polaribacter sp. Hel_I_88]